MTGPHKSEPVIFWWRRRVTIHSHAQIHIDWLGKSRVTAGMARKSIRDFKRKKTVLTARQEHLRSASGAQKVKALFTAKKCCLNGWSRYRTTFHSSNIFVVRFAVHRLSVSGLRKRREQGFRCVGGGSFVTPQPRNAHPQ